MSNKNYLRNFTKWSSGFYILWSFYFWTTQQYFQDFRIGYFYLGVTILLFVLYFIDIFKIPRSPSVIVGLITSILAIILIILFIIAVMGGHIVPEIL